VDTSSERQLASPEDNNNDRTLNFWSFVSKWAHPVLIQPSVDLHSSRSVHRTRYPVSESLSRAGYPRRHCISRQGWTRVAHTQNARTNELTWASSPRSAPLRWLSSRRFFSGWRTCGLVVFFTGSVAALGFARASAGLRSSRTPLCKQRPRLGSETISPAFGAVSGNPIRLPSACCSQKDPCLMQLNLTVDVLCSYQCKL